jgi:3-oxoacyl-[acyl-carrier protein] reductase
MNPPRTALVTAAGSGIGAEVARRLAGSGHRVLLVDLDKDAVTEVAGQLGPALAGEPWIVDARDAPAVTGLFQTLPAASRPDILVNAVGGDARNIPMAELDEDDLSAAYVHNVQTAFTFTRLSVPAMKERRWGRIVNLASIAGRTYSVFSNAAYVAAKAAVVGLTKQCAFELAPYGIAVNAVAHGPIATERIQQAWAGKSTAQREAILARIPLGRHGTIAEAAEAVLPFCGAAAGFVTGAVLDANGGMHI